MARYISIYPETQYEFQTNTFYYARWNFLPDKERVNIIVAQLTYLEFHEWLANNLRHHTRPDPRESNPSKLVFDVAEGFVKTDVLLYAAICEAALYVVAKASLKSNKDKEMAADLLAAFLTCDQKIVPLSKQTFTMEGTNISGKIGMCFTKPSIKKDSTITFDSLIKAARSIDAIKPDLAEKSDKLRKARNTIHLGEHIARRQATGGRFNEPDRQTAKQVTEEMRVQLASYCNTQKA
jgi:hypothetical protein